MVYVNKFFKLINFSKFSSISSHLCNLFMNLSLWLLFSLKVMISIVSNSIIFFHNIALIVKWEQSCAIIWIN